MVLSMPSVPRYVPHIWRNTECSPFLFRRHLRQHAITPARSQRQTFRRFLPTTLFWKATLLSLGTILTWTPAIAFILNNVFTITSVTGDSMYPFLNTDYNSTTLKDLVFLNKWHPARDLRRGMIVAFWSPAHPEVMAIKRIVAIEGDRIETKSPYPLPKEDVPVGHVWVEGENPMSEQRSYDSNYYGPVSKSLIVGRAVGVVWPLSRRGRIRWEDYRGSSRVMEGANQVEQIQFFSAG
ncbi:hypothetical protein ACLMJK_001685 [Lecanora helva]